MEDTRSLGIYLLMRKLGGFRIENLEERVFLQKVIYLLQLLGIDLRFRFGWYLRGPYSKDLASYAFDIKSNINEYKRLSEKAQIRDEVLRKLKKLEKVIDNKPEDIEKPLWLELISSIHYLKHIASSNPDIVTIENIEISLNKAGKRFEESYINAAWNQLQFLGLIDKKSHDRIS